MISNLFRPRKKETVLYFEEIGLTLSVPAFLAVLNKKQLITRLKKETKRGNKPTTSFATEDNKSTAVYSAPMQKIITMSGIMISLGDRRPVDAKNE